LGELRVVFIGKYVSTYRVLKERKRLEGLNVDGA